MYTDVALVARYFGRDPMLEYPDSNVTEQMQQIIDTAAYTVVGHSRQRQELLIQQLEVLRLLDVVLSNPR